MTLTVTRTISEEDILPAVREVEKQFAPDVIRIRYSFGYDQNDDPAVFFRVVARDEAASLPNCVELFSRLSIAFVNTVGDTDLRTYTDLRGVSDERIPLDPRWQ